MNVEDRLLVVNEGPARDSRTSRFSPVYFNEAMWISVPMMSIVFTGARKLRVNPGSLGALLTPETHEWRECATGSLNTSQLSLRIDEPRR